MKPWLKRTLKILGWLVGIVVVAIIGLVIFVNATWDKPHERTVSTRTTSTRTFPFCTRA